MNNSVVCSETIEELLALRKFKRSNAGMDLERLNAGERKKRVKAVSTETGMVEGTIGGLSKGKDRMRDEPEAYVVLCLAYKNQNEEELMLFFGPFVEIPMMRMPRLDGS